MWSQKALDETHVDMFHSCNAADVSEEFEPCLQKLMSTRVATVLLSQLKMIVLRPVIKLMQPV